MSSSDSSLPPTGVFTGRQLGRYRIETKLGAGGMAEVFQALDTKLDRRVAVKIITPAFAADGQFRERFLREAKVVASLDHPHILPLFDVGEEDGLPFLVMPLVTGGTLAERLRPRRPLPLEQVAVWVTQIASALDAAHAAGILHRDVKPGNVLIGQGGRLLLSDFGIARLGEATTRLTRTGTVVGTPIYMAPEVAHGEASGSSADLYSLAVMAFEMLAGRPPFDGENVLSILHQHAVKPAPPVRSFVADLPPAVDAAIGRGLAKEPQSRPVSCAAFAETLMAVLPTEARAALGSAVALAVADVERTVELPSSRAGLPLTAGPDEATRLAPSGAGATTARPVAAGRAELEATLPAGVGSPAGTGAAPAATRGALPAAATSSAELPPTTFFAPPQPQRRPGLLLGLAALVLLAGGFFYWQSSRPQPAAVAPPTPNGAAAAPPADPPEPPAAQTEPAPAGDRTTRVEPASPPVAPPPFTPAPQEGGHGAAPPPQAMAPSEVPPPGELPPTGPIARRLAAGRGATIDAGVLKALASNPRLLGLRTFLNRPVLSTYSEAAAALADETSAGVLPAELAAPMISFVAGGASYIAGQDEAAARSLAAATADPLFFAMIGPSWPVQLLAPAARGSGAFASWELAVAFGDPRRSAAAELDGQANQGDPRVQLARAFVHRLDRQPLQVAEKAGPAYKAFLGSKDRELAAVAATLVAEAYGSEGRNDDALSWYRKALATQSSFTNFILLQASNHLRTTHQLEEGQQLLRAACDGGSQIACERLRDYQDRPGPGGRRRPLRPGGN